jgi:hypothetical protein
MIAYAIAISINLLISYLGIMAFGGGLLNA